MPEKQEKNYYNTFILIGDFSSFWRTVILQIRLISFTLRWLDVNPKRLNLMYSGNLLIHILLAACLSNLFFKTSQSLFIFTKDLIPQCTEKINEK